MAGFYKEFEHEDQEWKREQKRKEQQKQMMKKEEQKQRRNEHSLDEDAPLVHESSALVESIFVASDHSDSTMSEQSEEDVQMMMSDFDLSNRDAEAKIGISSTTNEEGGTMASSSRPALLLAPFTSTTRAPEADTMAVAVTAAVTANAPKAPLQLSSKSAVPAIETTESTKSATAVSSSPNHVLSKFGHHEDVGSECAAVFLSTAAKAARSRGFVKALPSLALAGRRHKPLLYVPYA